MSGPSDPIPADFNPFKRGEANASRDREIGNLIELLLGTGNRVPKHDRAITEKRFAGWRVIKDWTHTYTADSEPDERVRVLILEEEG